MSKPEDVSHPDFADSGSILRDERLAVAEGPKSEKAGSRQPERHEFEFYLAVEDIDRSRTKTKSPQSHGIVERSRKATLNEFYRVAIRKKLYVIDEWIRATTRRKRHTFAADRIAS